MTSHNAISPEAVEHIYRLSRTDLSYDDIAKAVGVSKRTVERYLTGKPVWGATEHRRSALLQGWGRCT